MRRIEILGLALISTWACCPGTRQGGHLDRMTQNQERLSWPDGARLDRGTVDLSRDLGKQCSSSTECGDLVCVSGSCTRPTSCCQIHSLAPQRGDGEYELSNGAGSLVSTYCDMQLCISLPGELCSAVEGDHEGRTRDDSRLPFLVRSVLTVNGTCELWALRAKSDGHPLDDLIATTGLTLTTCQALGFKGDAQLGGCAFGSGAGSCGFSSSTYRYGNHCSGCTQNDGTYPKYVLQGPMTTAKVISTMSGTTRTSCRTR
jgi:hypothetical protein